MSLTLRDHIILKASPAVTILRAVGLGFAFIICIYELGEGRGYTDVIPFWLAILIGGLGPGTFIVPASMLWHQITPVKNKVTFWEDEMVFLISTLVSLGVGVTWLTPLPITEAFRLSAATVLLGAPLLLLRWIVRRSLFAIGKADAATLQALQSYQPELPEERQEGRSLLLGWLIGGSVTFFVILMLMSPFAFLQGAMFFDVISFTSLCGGWIGSVAMAPLATMTGHSLLRVPSTRPGRAYSFGSIAILMVMIGLGIPRIVGSGVYWPYVIAFLILAIALLCGGWVMDRVYKDATHARVGQVFT